MSVPVPMWMYRSLKIATAGKQMTLPSPNAAEPPAATAARADRAELDHGLPSPLHELGRAPLQRPPDVVDRARGRVVPMQHARRRYCTGERPYPPAMHGPIVETTSGKLIGATHRDTHVFRGIPFAAPPVGALRFRPPQPVAPWTGVRDALTFGPMAPQLPSALEALAGSTPLGQSEDCLTLNVWTPACDGAKRPVMVWIHGGGFTTGTAASPWYSGTNLALQGDVVVVTRELSVGCARLHAPRRPRRRGMGVVGQLRHPRSGRRAQMGARQHRRLRR